MKQKRLDCLEGVRALACVGVVLCHFQNGFFPNSSLAQALFKTPLYFLFSGNTAVRVLFTLSGFVLCYKYFRTDDDSAMERDALKRYLRLMLPTLAVTLLVYVMMKAGLLWNRQAAEFTGSQEFMGLFNQFEPNLLGSLKEGAWDALLKGTVSYVGPLWTMRYEMLGSYLTFGAAALLRSKRARYAFYLAYLLLFSDYYIYFVLGMMICDLYTHEEGLNRFLERHQAFSLVLHLGAWWYIGCITNLDVFPIRSLGFHLAVAVMFLTLLNSGILGRVWGNKAGVFLGKHSFSIYLLHWPVMESFSCGFFLYLNRLGLPHKGIVLADLAFTMVLILVLAAAFTYGVVLPAARLSDRFAALVLGSFKDRQGKEEVMEMAERGAAEAAAGNMEIEKEG